MPPIGDKERSTSKLTEVGLIVELSSKGGTQASRFGMNYNREKPLNNSPWMYQLLSGSRHHGGSPPLSSHARSLLAGGIGRRMASWRRFLLAAP